MDSTLQYMIDKIEHGRLIMGDKANINAVGANSHSQSSQGRNFKCLFCAGNHKTVDCNKYKSIQARIRSCHCTEIVFQLLNYRSFF